LPRSPSAAMKAKALKKMVKVVLNSDVEGLGKKGELIEVRPAYANNYLVPKGMGYVASAEMLISIEEEAAAAAAAAAASRKLADESKAVLQGKYKNGLVYETQVDRATGAPVASVTSQVIAAELSRSGVKVEADAIQMEEITEVNGSEVAVVQLHPDVNISVKVTVQKSKITFS